MYYLPKSLVNLVCISYRYYKTSTSKYTDTVYLELFTDQP